MTSISCPSLAFLFFMHGALHRCFLSSQGRCCCDISENSSYRVFRKRLNFLWDSSLQTSGKTWHIPLQVSPKVYLSLTRQKSAQPGGHVSGKQRKTESWVFPESQWGIKSAKPEVWGGKTSEREDVRSQAEPQVTVKKENISPGRLVFCPHTRENKFEAFLLFHLFKSQAVK